MAETQTRQTIQIHHIKAPGFETRHVDGALASKTFNNGVSLVFFVERHPIPQTVEIELLEDGQLGTITDVKGKQGVVREIQHGLLLREDTARALRDRLTEILDKNA